MGNCIRHHQSSATTFSDYDDQYWHDDDNNKSFATSSAKDIINNNNICRTATTAAAAKTTTEVKIKITKKQLAELLGKVDVEELRVEQVLAQLVVQSHGGGYDHNRPWRPVLQSIPELN